jgi:hypothetical protein
MPTSGSYQASCKTSAASAAAPTNNSLGSQGDGGSKPGNIRRNVSSREQSRNFAGSEGSDATDRLVFGRQKLLGARNERIR